MAHLTEGQWEAILTVAVERTGGRDKWIYGTKAKKLTQVKKTYAFMFGQELPAELKNDAVRCTSKLPLHCPGYEVWPSRWAERTEPLKFI